MYKRAWAFALLAVSGISSAQIVSVIDVDRGVSAPFDFQLTSGSTAVSSTNSGGSVRHLNDGSFTVVKSGSLPGTQTGVQTVQFNVKIGSAPIQISNQVFTRDGKIVNSAINSDTRLSVVHRVNLFRVIDTNLNGSSDPGETLQAINSWTAPTITQVGNGLAFFDSQIPLTESRTIFGADSVYLWEIQTLCTVANASLGDAFTIENNSPAFDGLSISYDFQTVPEPGTLALVGMWVAGLVARRRRR